MSELATFMRITGLQVTNQDVDARRAAVATLKVSWSKKKQVGEIIGKAAEVAHVLGGDGIPSEAFGSEVQPAIQKHASAFLYTESPLEVGIVAGLAAVALISGVPDESGWLTADVWATALWSALAFQAPLHSPKREELRTFVMEKARARSIDGAESARQRVTVPDFGTLALVAEQEAQFAESFKVSTNATVDALRRNSALDREELDFLWWALLDRSRLFNEKLLTLSEPLRAVTAGIETAAHLRRFPCDVHRDVVLKNITENQSLTLPQLLAEIGEDRNVLAETLTGATVIPPAVFPLLHALVFGSTGVDGHDVERSTSEWGARALLEAALSKMYAGPAKL